MSAQSKNPENASGDEAASGSSHQYVCVAVPWSDLHPLTWEENGVKVWQPFATKKTADEGTGDMEEETRAGKAYNSNLKAKQEKKGTEFVPLQQERIIVRRYVPFNPDHSAAESQCSRH